MPKIDSFRRQLLQTLGLGSLASLGLFHRGAMGMSSQNESTSLNSKSAQGEQVIRMGVTDLSFHRVTAAVVAQVIRVMGKEVQRSYALHEANFDRLGEGKVDMVCSAWLPHSHGIYRQHVEERVPTQQLGLHYEPYALWGVPDYVPAELVSSIEDLLKPEVQQRMRPTIQGIGEGAGITRFSKNIMVQYGLTAAGYQFKTGTQADCVAAFESAAAVNDWVIVPLWHPQFLHHQYRIRELQDPRGLLGGKDKAVLLARKVELTRNFSPEQIKVLDNIVMSNQIVAELDYAVNRQGMTEDEAAANWLMTNPQHLTTWLAPLLDPTKTLSHQATL
ncbi:MULTISPECIES: glycine betaine ABC transporter substrate-binding protein [unclassified Shewanella]|jgi:glycine betaine/proline transport system substrate-binding protein|uniref:glycine betaine ABC transporter substrate-binding protein n=1 Tax=unclassified Shewanella TaxID=196818 RepID=UPI001E4E4DAA|nr:MULTISPECIES: glycine betaine ABC transporter substrate-binding protein [unclassified Shewanella]